MSEAHVFHSGREGSGQWEACALSQQGPCPLRFSSGASHAALGRGDGAGVVWN